MSARRIEPEWVNPKERLPKPFERVWIALRSLKSDRENWVTDVIYGGDMSFARGEPREKWWTIPMVNMGQAEVYAWAPMEFPDPPEEYSSRKEREQHEAE